MAQQVKNLQETQETLVRPLGLGDSPGGGNDDPLQYSWLKNPMDRGTWRATVHGVTKSQIRLSDTQHKGWKGVKGKSLSRVRLLATHGLYSPWNSPGQNTGVDSLSLLQRIFPAQNQTWSPALQADSLPTELSGRQGEDKLGVWDWQM